MPDALPVLIPVNQLDRAKGRLAEMLDPAARVRLFLATVRTVIGAANDAGMRPIVLTRDPRIAVECGRIATILDEDPAVSGLNAQLESAIHRLGALAPLPELLILHADLPLATGEALRELAAAAPQPPSVTLVCSPDGGTNAMLLRPPAQFALAYGKGSFELHRDAALAAGVSVHEASIPALALDLDTPADVARLMGMTGGPDTPAGQVLAALGFAPEASR